VQLTVVNPRDEFVERIRLHQLAARPTTAVTRALKDLLHPDARLLLGGVELVDSARRVAHVSTDSGRVEVGWDHLIHAVGSVPSASIPGAGEHAFPLGDLDGARGAAEALENAGDAARVLVVGGGPTGVETAAEIAENRPSVEVALMSAGPVLPAMRPRARRSVLRRLRRLGVSIAEDSTIVGVEAGKVQLDDGRMTAFDVCLLATSFEVPDLAKASGLAVDDAGRLRVDTCLRSVTDPSVLGAGDAIAVPGPAGSRLRMACAVALPLGGHAAEVLLADVRGEAPQPFSMAFSAQCLSLGRGAGYIQPVRRDDSPRPWHIGGWAGARVKEAVCRRVVEGPSQEKDKPGSYSWRR
jgi:NADH dehydrogenase FAD-containing subunit